MIKLRPHQTCDTSQTMPNGNDAYDKCFITSREPWLNRTVSTYAWSHIILIADNALGEMKLRMSGSVLSGNYISRNTET